MSVLVIKLKLEMHFFLVVDCWELEVIFLTSVVEMIIFSSKLYLVGKSTKSLLTFFRRCI